MKNDGSKDYVFFNAVGSKYFDGVIMDTGANRNSVIWINKDRKNFSRFMVTMRINYSDKNAVIEIS